LRASLKSLQKSQVVKKKAEEIEQSGGEEKIAAKEITIRRRGFIIYSTERSLDQKGLSPIVWTRF